MDAASICKAKNRDLMLVYSHDEKEVFLIDEAHGGGNMVGFGMLLDSRITNPLAEEWAAFWLDGNDGMALSITWAGSGRGGQMDWIKPISIDFVPRHKAPVPDWVWGKAVELSELLVKVSDNELWAMYQELPPEEFSKEDEPEEEAEEDEPEEEAEEDEPEEEADDDEGDEYDEMDRSQLKALIRERNLDLKVVKSMSDDDIRNAIRQAEDTPFEGDEEEDEPATPPPPPPPPPPKQQAVEKTRREESPRTRTATTASSPKEEKKVKTKTGSCPGGGTLGKDFNELDGCKNCPDSTYDACAAASS